MESIVPSFPLVVGAAATLAGAAVVIVLLRSRGPLGLRLLALYPKKLGSRLVGLAARMPLPGPARAPLLGAFARAVGAEPADAERPLSEYASVQDFFTRRLRPGLRPQAEPVPGAVNSPVDGRLVTTGRVERDVAVQAKGLPYRISELLDDASLADRFEGASYLVLYLAPRDYHRIHVPFAGSVHGVRRIDGDLWPVNATSTQHVPRLYPRNRRVTWTATGRDVASGLELALVMVGATHVGRIVLDERWLDGPPLRRGEHRRLPDLPCAPGDDLGVFELGSTVVLLIGGSESRRWSPTRPLGPCHVGERLGCFTPRD